MEFRLVYKGSLKAEGSGAGRSKEKQLLRKEFHKQLAELWKQHPTLRQQLEEPLIKSIAPANSLSPPPGEVTIRKPLRGETGAKPWVDHVAENYNRFGYRFVPLVREEGGFTCSLEILFLRRDNPGHLVHSGGDIDNRIKVLFDGLKMPKALGEIGGYTPESSEDPFFCLLEDDSLITGVAITTDRLLLPMEPSEHVNDVHLIIHVKVSDPLALFFGNRLV